MKSQKCEKLFVSCLGGNIEGVSDVLSSSDGLTRALETGLQLACENGHAIIVGLLISKGVDFRANANWAVRVAAKNGHVDVVRVLIGEGVDVWNDGSKTYTSRIEPGFEKHYPITEIGGGASAFKLASEGGHLPVLQFIESVSTVSCEHWLDCLCRAAENGFIDVIKYIAEKNLKIGEEPLICARSNYALRFSAAKGNLEAVKLLVDAGADVKAKKNQAIRWAAEKGRLEVFKYLIKKGSGSKTDAFENAALAGHFSLVSYFVDKGLTDEGDRDEALQLAVSGGSLETAEFLIKKGVSKKAKKDAFEVAMYNERERIAEILDSGKYRQIVLTRC